MDRGLFQVARATTGQGEIVPLELPDINVTDCAVLQVKRVGFIDEKQPRSLRVRDGKSGSLSRSDENRISVDRRPVCAPFRTAAVRPRSPDADETPSPRLTKRDSSNLLPVASSDELQLLRRFSHPNPVPPAEFKLPLKKSVSLPPSPVMVRRRGSRGNTASGEAKVAQPPRPKSTGANCFGRNRSLTDGSRPSSSHSKSWLGFQWAYNDPELNPVLISPDQIQMTPSNMHLRSTGFELRHRVMRRAFRLSDLSATAAPEHQQTAGAPPAPEGGDMSAEQHAEAAEGCKRQATPRGSLEEQFKVLQHCRYLRHPVDFSS